MTLGNHKPDELERADQSGSDGEEVAEATAGDTTDASGTRDRGRDRAVKSVEHALDLLDLLARHRTAAGVTQLAEELGMNVSTAHHLLRTLRTRGFVEQDPDSKLYRLGVRSVQLGEAYLTGLDLYAIARSRLRDVARESGETVTLIAIDGSNPVTLATIPGRFTVRSLGATTSRHNAHATALGKILLAGLTSSELHDVVAESGLTRFTPYTIGTLRQLESDLAQVRQRGYALDLQELEEGLGCAAVGVLNYRRETVAAIGVSVPIARFDEARRAELIKMLQETASRIAARLGYERDGDP